MSSSQCLLKILRPVCVPKVKSVRFANLTVLVSSRGLHRNVPSKKSGLVKPLKKKYADEKAEGDAPASRRRPDAKDPDEKKVEMKEWTERSPAWLNRDHTESELAKHIEVLQRFADRYNTALSNESAGKSKLQEKEESRKRLLKVLDKQSNKKYSTFVRAQGRKKKDFRTDRRNRGGSWRAFITLANEPRRPERISAKPKPVVPVTRNFMNPDSVRLKSMVTQTVKPKLYYVVNPKFKNKEFEAYVKKMFTGRPSDKTKERKPEATVGEYFIDRYSNKKKTKPDGPEMKTGPDLTADLQKSLVEDRRSVTTTITKPKTEPTLHPRTSLLVQRSHLPLTLCKNVKQAGQDKTELVPSPPKKPAVPANTEQQDQASSRPKDYSLLNRLMKYFKR